MPGKQGAYQNNLQHQRDEVAEPPVRHLFSHCGAAARKDRALSSSGPLSWTAGDKGMDPRGARAGGAATLKGCCSLDPKKWGKGNDSQGFACTGKEGSAPEIQGEDKQQALCLHHPRSFGGHSSLCTVPILSARAKPDGFNDPKRSFPT